LGQQVGSHCQSCRLNSCLSLMWSLCRAAAACVDSWQSRVDSCLCGIKVAKSWGDPRLWHPLRHQMLANCGLSHGWMASKRMSCQHLRFSSWCYSCRVRVPPALTNPWECGYSPGRTPSADYGLSSAKVSLILSSSRKSLTDGRFWQAQLGLSVPHSATCLKVLICLSLACGALSPYTLDSGSKKALRIESNWPSIFLQVQVHRLGNWQPHLRCSAKCGPYLAQLSTKT